MMDDSNCHGNKALTMKPTSVLTKIISRNNYLSLTRSRIDSLIGMPLHFFALGTFLDVKNPTDVMILHSNCFDDKTPTIKPTSVLSKIISKINYLSLARSRIDLSIGIPPHFFTSGTVF